METDIRDRQVVLLSVVSMSLYDWTKVPTEKMSEKLSRQLISGKNVMVARLFLKRGCTVAVHSHESEQISYVLGGALKLHLPKLEVTLKENNVLHIPPNVEHSAAALEDTTTLDIFSPIREDWLRGNDAYLRR